MIEMRVSWKPASILFLLAFGNAQAHMPYLLPNAFDVGKRDYVTVQGSFTEVFFTPDAVMKSDDYHVVTPDGVKQALVPVYTRDLAVVETATKEAGTYRISTGRRTGRVAKAAWVNGDWKFLGREEAAPAGTKAYDVTSITTAEVYVTRGKPTDKAVAPRNAGLEFRALTHPNSVFVGSEAKFEVLFDGKPLANQVVSVYDDKARYSDKKIVAEVTTDGAGRFVIKPEKAGAYVAMTRYRPAPVADGQTGVSYTYSLVVEATD
ncbi:MAG: DUF4198 domain-containing protein [Steroidobacteraceae bacterium]